MFRFLQHVSQGDRRVARHEGLGLAKLPLLFGWARPRRQFTTRRKDGSVILLLRLLRYNRGMTDTGLPIYRRSARSDVRMWVLLAFGVAFFWAGSMIRPEENCSGDGRECAPWLVPLAQGFGALVALGAGLNMLANPRRGSMLDSATGDLVWWQGRIGHAGGDEGRIHPSRIGKLRIVRESEGDDEVHLYDIDGNRLFWFDHEVIPWPYERWAAKLAKLAPHIEVEVID